MQPVAQGPVRQLEMRRPSSCTKPAVSTMKKKGKMLLWMGTQGLYRPEGASFLGRTTSWNASSLQSVRRIRRAFAPIALYSKLERGAEEPLMVYQIHARSENLRLFFSKQLVRSDHSGLPFAEAVWSRLSLSPDHPPTAHMSRQIALGRTHNARSIQSRTAVRHGHQGPFRSVVDSVIESTFSGSTHVLVSDGRYLEAQLTKRIKHSNAATQQQSHCI